MFFICVFFYSIFNLNHYKFLEPYSNELIEQLRDTFERCGEPFAEGVYAGMLGPSGATRSELRMLEQLHADVYGMSTVTKFFLCCEL